MSLRIINLKLIYPEAYIANSHNLISPILIQMKLKETFGILGLAITG